MSGNYKFKNHAKGFARERGTLDYFGYIDDALNYVEEQAKQLRNLYDETIRAITRYQTYGL